MEDDRLDWVNFWSALSATIVLGVAVVLLEGRMERIPIGVRGTICLPLIPLGLWVGWSGLLSGDWRKTGFAHQAQGILRLLLGAGLAAFGVVGMLGW